MNKTIKTWLPVFQGFYGTLFEFDDNLLLENYGINSIDIDIDYKEYQNDIAVNACEFIESECDFIKLVKFENVSSPKFYNFSNDSINCQITIDVNKLSDYINNNVSEFRAYLKNNYTSCSGFISRYSNDAEEWKESTENFTTFFDNHLLGALLQFYFVNEIEDANSDMYYFCSERICEGDYINKV